MLVSHGKNLKQALDDLESARKRLEAELQRSETWQALSVVDVGSRRSPKARRAGQGKRQLRRKLLAESPVYRSYLRLVDAISLLRQAADMPAAQLPSAQELDGVAHEQAAKAPAPGAKPRVKIKAVSRSLPQATAGDGSSHDAEPITLSAILAEAGFRIGDDAEPHPPTPEAHAPVAKDLVRLRPEESFPVVSVEEAEVIILHGEAAKFASSDTGEAPPPVALSTRLKRAVQDPAQGEKPGPFQGIIEEAEVEIFRPSDAATGTTTS
jgi:hypothetical protein